MAQIFEKKKYLKGQSRCDSNLLLKHNCSTTWKGIMFGSQLLKKGLVWRLSKGDNIDFWKDKWFGDDSLIHKVEVTPEFSMDTMVFNFFVNGWWNIERLRSILPKEWVPC